MAKFSSDQIRNVCLIGHGGDGSASLQTAHIHAGNGNVREYFVGIFQREAPGAYAKQGNDKHARDNDNGFLRAAGRRCFFLARCAPRVFLRSRRLLFCRMGGAAGFEFTFFSDWKDPLSEPKHQSFGCVS